MSDVDMFDSEPITRVEYPSSVRQTASCPMPVRFQYGFIILFNWDVQIRKPFAVFQLNDFSTSEISNYWIDNKLEEKWRIKTLKPLQSLPDKKLSLFAKVEKCEF